MTELKVLNNYHVSEVMKKEKRFSTTYNIYDSIEKLLSYVGLISKVPFSIKIPAGKKYKIIHFTPPKNFRISDNLFRSYNCLDYNCSRCCWKKKDWNVWTEQQYKEHKSISPNSPNYDEKIICTIETIDTIGTIVNTKTTPFVFYVENHTEKICRHLDQEKNMCTIHETNPIHCALPLVKFRYDKRKQITTITREYYHRNWYMNCPVKFSPMSQLSFEKTIWLLNRVKKMAEELNIPTHIEEIIQTTNKRWKEITSPTPPPNLFSFE